MTCGVYEIVSPSGKRYIGSSKEIESRRPAHFSLLRRGRHHSRALQAAWNKHGKNLEFRVLLVCSPANRLWYEQRAIDVFRPKFNGLATAICGAQKGHPVSEKTRKKLSDIHKGRRMGGAVSRPWQGKQFSPEHKEKLAAAKIGKVGPRLGKTLSAEARASISTKLKGRKRSIEARAKQSATLSNGGWHKARGL